MGSWILSLLFMLQAGALYAQQAESRTGARPSGGQRSFVNYLQNAPVKISGQVQLNSQYRHSSGVVIKKDNPIGFAFNYHEIKVTSEDGIRYNWGPIPIFIQSVYYNDKTGEYDVRIKTLGIGVDSETAEKRIQETLGRQMKAAFRQIRGLHFARSIADAQGLLQNILKIFKGDGSGPPFPDVRGEFRLEVEPASTEEVSLPGGFFQMRNGESFNIGANFRTRRGSFNISGLSLHSAYQLRFRRHNARRAEVLISSITADEQHGVYIVAENIYDNKITTLITALEALTKYVAGNPTAGVTTDCPEIRIVEEMIANSFNGNLQEFIEYYRPQLIAGGISPQLLERILTQRRQQGPEENNEIVVTARRRRGSAQASQNLERSVQRGRQRTRDLERQRNR